VSHCTWCAEPWRAVLIAMARQKQRASVICRHYGLRTQTVVVMLANARRLGCLPHPTCRHCPVRIAPQRVVCGKKACRAALDRDGLRLRRARFGHARTPRAKERRGHKETPGLFWPELPPNPRERNPRAPNPSTGAPIRYVASLLGVGGKNKEVRDAAIAAYEATLRAKTPPPVPPPPPKPQVITPFRPLSSPAPRNLWEATRALHASGRKRPRSTYVLAPPMCHVIGSLTLRKAAT
jgi:hypothetical protein